MSEDHLPVCNTPKMKLWDTSLEKLLKFNLLTIAQAKRLPCMMHTNILAIKQAPEMHL